MPCISLNSESGEVVVSQHACNTGDKHRAIPIYLMLCECGYPLKAMFRGATPALVRTSTVSGYDGKERIEISNYKNKAWGFTLKNEHCPLCGGAVSIGPSLVAAGAKFIQTHVVGGGSRYSSRGRIVLTDRIKAAIEKIILVKGLRIVKEHVAGRTDYAIVWRTGNEDHNWQSGDFDTWYAKREAEISALKNTLGMTDEPDTEEEETNPYDFSDEVLNAHDEECTCSLCVK